MKRKVQKTVSKAVRPPFRDESPVQPIEQPKDNRRPVLGICILLLLAVAVVYCQTIRFNFVDFDDSNYIYENVQVQKGLTLSGIVWAFTDFHSWNWHPLTWIGHIVDYQLYGLWPGGHHLTNVLLHAATTIILFLVLRQMTNEIWPSALVAALFAVHPLHVESVAWVAERKDVLSGLFFVLTLAAYQGYIHRPSSIVRYLLLLLCFALGLLSKPMLVTLPFVLLLLDYWPLQRWAPFEATAIHSSRRVFAEKIPLMLLAAVSCAATLRAQKSAIIPLDQYPWSSRIANALVSYCAYLGQFFWPADMAAFYPYPHGGQATAAVVGSLILLLGVPLSAVAWRRRYPFLLIGWLWYLGMLIPVIGLVQVSMQSRADRYMYLPMIGPSMALAWGTLELVKHSFVRRWLIGSAWFLALAILGSIAWQQTSYWHDSEALWTHALTATTRNWLAEQGVGNALLDRGRVDEAVRHYRKALEIRPASPETLNDLGRLLARRGDVDGAIVCYRMALIYQPDHAQAHKNLGIALFRTGKAGEAIAHYRMALKTQPSDAQTHCNLGMALLSVGKPDEALDQFQKALDVEPDLAEAHYDLGNVLAERGEIDKAIDHYEKVLQIKPDDVDAIHNLAVVVAQRKQRLMGKPHRQPPRG